MPEHLFTVVARGHAVDAQSNTLTLFSLIEVVNAPELPFGVPEFTVATHWERREGEEGVSFEQRTQLLDPSGKEVFHGNTSFRLDRPRHRVLVTIHMAPFREVGRHHVEVLIRREDEEEWVKAATCPIDVNVTPLPAEKQLFDEDKR